MGRLFADYYMCCRPKTRIYVLYIATFTILSIYTKKQIVLSKNLLHHNDIFFFMIYLYIVYCDNASAL